MSALTVAVIAEAVGGRVRGDGTLLLSGMATLDSASPSQLSFLTLPAYRERAQASRAGCLIVGDDGDFPDRTVIVAADPHRAFALAMRLFHPPETRPPGVSPEATVHESAVLAAGVHVSARVVVGAGCRVGEQSQLLPGCVVGDGCTIGRECVVHPGAVLHAGTALGDRVVVHANAVIGADGFGYASGADGHLKIPQVGSVVIEDDVEIGACACVDRGVLGETRIGRGTKIDNLVQVGHNVTIGPDCILVAQSGISGSTRLGAGTAIAGQSGVAGHLTLGAGARVAAKSAVLADVAPGETVGGIPAVPHGQWKRVAAALTRLPELVRRVRRLESVAGTTEERTDERSEDT